MREGPSERTSAAPGVPLGRITGIPLRVTGALIVGAGFGLTVFIVLAVASGEPFAVLAVAPAVALGFGSLLLHEYAHALFARHHGFDVDYIALGPAGGTTAYSGLPPSPGEQIQIATAGPLASASLAAICAAVALVGRETLVGRFFEAFAGLNLLLAALNLLPVPSLDGGQIVAGVRRARRERANDAL